MSQEKKIVEETIEEIKKTTELFYNGKKEEAYNQMQEAISVIIQMVDVLHEYHCEHESFSFDEKRVATALTEAMQAMEAGDTTLVADILEYDFVEYLQELLTKIEE